MMMELEFIEARALKSSFLSQMSSKPNSQVFCADDVWCLAGINSDDFPVEDLLNLDFSDKEMQQQEGSFFVEDDQVKPSNSIDHSSIFTDAAADGSHNLSAVELSVPVEDLESLEWLSQFVDDSSSEFSLLCPTASFPAKTGAVLAANRIEPENKPVLVSRDPCFPSKVPGKARSKRPRENRRPWSLVSPTLSSDESSSASSSSHGSNIISISGFTNRIYEINWFSAVENPPAAKKPRIKLEVDGGIISGRRCTHCLVQKTPQWRAGPLGPKTLCNACGVRFKSGRLFPEYRPACSPTFSQEIHSNSHRKVLEMRRRMEVYGTADLTCRS